MTGLSLTINQKVPVKHEWCPQNLFTCEMVLMINPSISMAKNYFWLCIKCSGLFGGHKRSRQRKRNYCHSSITTGRVWYQNDILCHRIDEEHKISPSLGHAVICKVSRNTSQNDKQRWDKETVNRRGDVNKSTSQSKILFYVPLKSYLLPLLSFSSIAQPSFH